MIRAAGSGDCPVCGRRNLRLNPRAKNDKRGPATLRAHYPQQGKISADYCPGSFGAPGRKP